jgi:flagellar motor protein MotB
VTVRFIGYTDDAPLTGRDEQTYGNHLSLSKARASASRWPCRRSWDCRPRRSKATVAVPHTRLLQRNRAGTALNRRIEVEFWYDDPLRSCRMSRNSAPAISRKW